VDWSISPLLSALRRNDQSPVVSREIAADAAVWVARLHGADRSSAMERDCLAWLAASEEHRLAFERCTEVWQEVPRVKLDDAYGAAAGIAAARSSWHAPAFRGRVASALALVGLVTLGTVVLQQWLTRDAYSTSIGEEQLLVLDDGTRMSLNTSTRVRVELSAAQRSVTVEAGEALFEVARDAERPFVVRAGGSEVVALGTVFSVRLGGPGAGAGDALTVALMEGSVSVRAAAHAASGEAGVLAPVLMQPGQRMRLATAGGAQLDQPRMEPLVAWKRGEAVFDDVALEEAVAEMNRYSRTPIVLVGGSAVAARRISGHFRTGDSAGFAQAVAALHGLAVREREGRLELGSRA